MAPEQLLWDPENPLNIGHSIGRLEEAVLIAVDHNLTTIKLATLLRLARS